MNLKKFIIGAQQPVSFVLRKGNDTLLSQSYVPGTDGLIEVDIRDIVHSHLSYILKDIGGVYEQTALSSDFTAVIDGENSITFRVIRSGVDQLADTASNFLTQNFLTWQPTVKPVTYYSPEFLTYYAVVPGTIKLRAYFTDDDGKVTSQMVHPVADLAAGIAYTIPLQYSLVAGWLGNRLPAYYDVWVEDASGQRLTYIQRYYAENMRSVQEQWILFENSLGGVDTFRAYGNTVFNGEHTHNIAEIDEIFSEYRVDTERKFQKNTGYLNGDERKWLLDFFPSNGKYLYAGNYLRRIVVTDSNVSYTDRELPSNYTFTFKYADARPLLNLPRTDIPADVLDITVPEVGSFSIPPRLAEFSRLPLSEGVLFPVQHPYSEEWGTTTTNSIADYIAIRLASNAGDGGGVGHTHSNMDLLNMFSTADDYLLIGGKKINAGYADKAGSIDGLDDKLESILDKCIRKDQPDSTLYPVDFTAGLSINSKRIGDVIRYYDEDKPVATDANIYSALQTDQRIEEAITDGFDDKYLRKDKEDTAHKHITFEEGITVHDLAELMDLDVQQLATIAQAVCAVVRSSKFVDGFAGEGYRIWQDIASGDWCMTLDRLTVRKVLTIYEMVVAKIRSVGGMIVVSAANGVIRSAEKVGGQYAIGFDDVNQFVAGDLMRCQVFSPTGLKYYWVRVSAVDGDKVYVPASEFAGVEPVKGDEVVLMGNTDNKSRQNLILISATEDGQPRFDCLDGVKSKSLEGCLKVRVGALDGISDSRFPADMQPGGYGLYGNNCFLTGVFVLGNGKDVMTMFSIMEGMIKSEISSVRNELSAADNYLNNAAFSDSMSYWSGASNIRIFSVSGKLLRFGGNFYSNKQAFAGITADGSRNVLRIKGSSITQKNADFARHPEFDRYDVTETDGDGNEAVAGRQCRTRMFYVSFRYKVTRPGTLRVYFKGEDPDGFEEYTPIDHTEVLNPAGEFKVMEIAGKWNGTGDFFLAFSGDMYLYSLALADNRLADVEERFTSRLEITDSKVQANLDEIHRNATLLEEYHSEFLLTAQSLQAQFTENLSDAESRITEAYRSYVDLTAQELTVQFTGDITDAESRITEAYTSAIGLSAQGLQAQFTADITDMEEGITEAYKSYVDLSAQELQAGFTADLTDLRTGITEAYTSAIGLSAQGLRAEFGSSVSDLDGRLTAHESSFHVTAGKIDAMVSATDSISDTIRTAGWITTADGNELWAAHTDLSREADNARILAAAGNGKSLYGNPTFREEGTNGISVYNNAGGSAVTLTRKAIDGVPNDSGYGLEIATAANGSVTPGLGGFCFQTATRANRLLVCRFMARIPAGYTVEFATNDTGTGGTRKWLTAHKGTGGWEEYAYYVRCGGSGTFSSTFFFYLSGADASTGASRPVTWHLAMANVYELSAQDLASRVTKISQTVDGIYMDVYDSSGKFASLKMQVDAIGAVVGDGTTGSFSEFQQTVESLTAQVADNKEAAAGALAAAQDAASAASNAQGKADSAYDKAVANATAITQTNSAISAIAGRFDVDGHLIEGAGWLTTADAATLYATRQTVDSLDGRMTAAESRITANADSISLTVGKDGVISAINQTAEDVTIDASRINLNGVISANGNFKIGLDGVMEAVGASITGTVQASVFSTPFITLTASDFSKPTGADSDVLACYYNPENGSNVDVGNMLSMAGATHYLYLSSAVQYGSRVTLYNRMTAYTRLATAGVIRMLQCKEILNLTDSAGNAARQFTVKPGKMVELVYVNVENGSGVQYSRWYVTNPENCENISSGTYRDYMTDVIL